MTKRQCLQWVTVPHGQTGDHQRRPGCPHYNRCLLWLDRWGMRCALSADRQMPRDNNLEVDHLLIRTGDFVPNHRLDAITLRSGVSVVDSLDTCNHVVHARTHPYCLSQLVGFFSQMDANRVTEKIKRKTPLRPGPHPHLSACASLDPHSSFMY